MNGATTAAVRVRFAQEIQLLFDTLKVCGII
jgi:hypothetical protein